MPDDSSDDDDDVPFAKIFAQQHTALYSQSSISSAAAAPKAEAPPPVKPPPPASSSGEKKKKKSASTEPTAADTREAEKMAMYMRQFEKMEEAEQRRQRYAQMKREREVADPCTCGHARARRLPKPLAPGGPRCPRCTPLVARPMGASKPIEGKPHEIVDAPLFCPTEEEFADPMAYIRSVQAQAYEFGIFRIQPPPSFRPPKIFHRHRDAENYGGVSTAASQPAEADLAPPPPADAVETDGVQSAIDADADHTKRARHSAAAAPSRSDAAVVGDAHDPQHDAHGEDAYGEQTRLGRRPSAADYTPIGPEDSFEARLQAIKARPAVEVGGPAAGSRAGPFICSFTHKYARYSLEQYKALDAQLRATCFAPVAADGAGAGTGTTEAECPPPSPEQVEQWFWDGLASESEGRILYCSDLDGTAFPRTGTYGAHPWSLQQLAEHERGLLRFVEYAIPGVNTPMLYFGMLFSMFCWHVEDQYMYSTSYLHEGAPKTWYGVSPRYAERFERTFSRAFASKVDVDPELFVKKASMVPPWQLLDAGVPVCRAVQQAGQFVVTLPQGYHAGFSHGFNTAEAVNFVLIDWLSYARLRSQPVRHASAHHGRPPPLSLSSLSCP
jgi:hypothetical protein